MNTKTLVSLFGCAVLAALTLGAGAASNEAIPHVGNGSPAGEALDGIFISGDGTGMNWIRLADSREMPWIGPEF